MSYAHRVYRCAITGIAPLQFSRHHGAPKIDDNETPGDYDDRTWRLKAPTNKAGNVIIPADNINTFLQNTAQRMAMKLSGSSKFGNVFKSGTMVSEPLDLLVRPEALVANRVFVNADGRRGSGKRVWRTFPMLHDWGGYFDVTVFRTEITEKILAEHVNWGGMFIGLGAFRPENGRTFGRFTLDKCKALKAQEGAAIVAVGAAQDAIDKLNAAAQAR